MRFVSLNDLDQTGGTVQLQKGRWIPVGNDVRGSTDIILVPAPSKTDPNDPLRWPKWKKHVAFASVCAFTFLTNYAIGGLAPAFYILHIEFDQSMTATSHLLLWPILVLGLFNFFWVPIANYIGKRPVFVFASLLLCVSYVWGAVATSFRSLLWSNIIAAFAGSSTEALGASMVNDLYYLHERGQKMGIYMNAISGGNTLGPLICGFIVQSLGWRWHKWIAVIFTALNFLAVLLFVPETSYARDLSNAGPQQTQSESTLEVASTAEKSATVGFRPRSETSEEAIPQLPRKSFWDELRLWTGTSSVNLFKLFFRPLPMVVYPAVVYSFLCYSISLVLVVAVNILNAFVLQAPPYNWQPQINGLINIPGIIGNLIGAWLGGDLVDMWCAHRTKRNAGIFEPESRLYMLVVPLCITSAGCILFGYGVQQQMSWVALFFGYGMISVALTATPTITMAYISDCLLPVNSDALLLVNGLKNIVAFGFLYAVVPWVEEVGYVDCFGTMAGIYAAVVGTGAVLLILYGALARRTMALWRVILE